MSSSFRPRSSSLLVLMCVVFICGSSAAPQDNEIDLLSRIQSSNEDSDSLSSIMWGLPDSTAIAGKFFQYHLPRDAFHGKVTAYKVTESGSDSLPTWLYFDADTNTLEGVAVHGEIGKLFYIEVTATALSNVQQETQTKDVFSIHIIEDSAYSTESGVQTLAEHSEGDDSRPIKCLPGSAVTSATVIIDTDVELLTPQASRDILVGMSRHLGLPVDAMKIVTIGSALIDDDSALVAGPGDIKAPLHGGLLLQWEVGCGNVFANHMTVLERVETSSADGSMTNAVGHGVVGWHVTKKKKVPTATLR